MRRESVDPGWGHSGDLGEGCGRRLSVSEGRQPPEWDWAMARKKVTPERLDWVLGQGWSQRGWTCVCTCHPSCVHACGPNPLPTVHRNA